jgi:hypothetical protein
LIQQVSNVANATVNKANNVADTVYTFCETHVPGSEKSVLIEIKKSMRIYLIRNNSGLSL